MESRDENEHNEQGPCRTLLCNTIEVGCTFEKLYCSGENSKADKAEEQPGTRVDFVEPQRKKHQSTSLPRINNSIASGMTKPVTRGESSNTTRISRDSSAHTSITPDAMTWASTWEKMNRTLEALATRNTDSTYRGGGKSRKTFSKPKEFKDGLDGFIDTWVEVMRLHLEQDILNDERHACTAILSNLETLNGVVAKKEEERDTADKAFEILLNQFGSAMKRHQAMMRFEKKRHRDDESIDRFLDDLKSMRRTKKIEFSPIGNGHENTNNAPETIKYDSQTKRSPFTKKLAAMVGKKLREKEEVTTVTEKSKKFLVRFPR